MALKGTLDGETRRAALLELAEERGGLPLAEAAELWDVHPMTIRRDFELLESAGRVRRVRGGVVPVQADPFAARQAQNVRAKERIAAKILPLLPAGAAVGLDSSTTAFVVAEALPAEHPLTVVTNGLAAFEALSRKPGVRGYLTGGEREEQNLSLVGALTESAFSAFHFDVAVVSALGLHAGSGTSESTLAQAAVKDALARASATVVLALDASKLESRARVRSLGLDRVDVLVTELDPADARLAPYRAHLPRIL
ncbi:DeoR/GlpR transcriptional regulator [Herbiconiux sp. VKM Ac-1786]|uniref:DeoR/GlpR family DNA-binding transcription regulator n=1 Tax=Herbiconiux sp. VKM Ac-1786 TaxID=2783824 RepID=UPI00188BA5B3|nr:DeoR/GlpR family DNA-binding transcription regulator [Herbiconiux sp. VKM Ac-1786]MBF4573085.1 DeoR/GlpR transcriptional regulator [Herbiconiux sp. VKM Ac-1786]